LFITTKQKKAKRDRKERKLVEEIFLAKKVEV